MTAFLGDRPAPTSIGNLAELAAPKHRVLAEFIHGCAPDSPTRTMAATALVLTLWQVAGRSMTTQLPSMILLNAGEAAPDPIDAVVDQLATGLGYHDSQKKGEDKCTADPPEEAVEAVLSAVKKRKRLSSLTPFEAA